jgi:hypothetical protein
MMRDRLIAVVRLRDGIVGKYVKVRVLREVLEAVSERSLAIFTEGFASRIRQPYRLSWQIRWQKLSSTIWRKLFVACAS